jgi:hypothetical protein
MSKDHATNEMESETNPEGLVALLVILLLVLVFVAQAGPLVGREENADAMKPATAEVARAAA